MIRLAVLLALLAGSAAAETRRVAVVVGHNVGGGARPPLRFAEADADKIARVLTELGGVRPADLFLQRGGGRAALDATLARAAARVSALRAAAADRVVLIFYFSGHSDGLALELGVETLSFVDLRRWLGATGAEVRLAMIDSCKSGALLALKGGTPGPAFEIRLTDELSSAGEALLTSSAADESALESAELGGSFFTHHLVSGLRGAADASGDGTVTLSEAYQYAYGQTLAATGATLYGPQHATYAYRLSGTGDLVLTATARPTAALELPVGFQRALVRDAARGQVIAELPRGAGPAIALPPGTYDVTAWLVGRPYRGRVAVTSGTRKMLWSDLTLSPVLATAAKGGELALARTAEPAPRGLVLALAAGVASGSVAEGLGGQAAARLAIGTAAPTGLELSLAVATGAAGGVRETSATVALGARLGVRRGRLTSWIGGTLGAGGILQTVEDGASRSTPTLAIGPWLGASLRARGNLALSLEAQLTEGVLRRDGGWAAVTTLAAWLGVRASL